MNPLPAEIVRFLNEYHVASLAVCDGDAPWAASVFFGFDAAIASIVFLSHLDTRHAQMLLANSRVAGTVAGQPADVAGITGLQFDGVAHKLDDEPARRAARDLYDARFPYARAMNAPVWRVELRHLKLTDNRVAFGHKTLWDRHAAAQQP